MLSNPFKNLYFPAFEATKSYLWSAPLPCRPKDKRPAPITLTQQRLRQHDDDAVPTLATVKRKKPIYDKTFSEILISNDCDRLTNASHTVKNCKDCLDRMTKTRRLKRIVLLGAISIVGGLSAIFWPISALIPVLTGALINT